MKRQKRFSIILAVAIIFATLLGGTSSYAGSDFVDMPNNWAKTGLEHAVKHGLLEGNAKNEIKPKDNLTREQLAAISVRLLGLKEEADLEVFKDFEDIKWSHDALSKAVAAGILKGSNGRLNPKEPATRQEVFVVMARAFVLEGSNEAVLDGFKDGKDVEKWAREATSALVENKYIEGNALKELEPKKPIKRQEFAKMLMEMATDFAAGSLKDKTIDGNLIVNSKDIDLDGVTIKGDLILGEGLEFSDINLSNTKVEGRIVVRAGKQLKLKATEVNKIVVSDKLDDFTAELDKESTVDSLVTESKVTIKGNGRLKEAIFKEGSDGSKIETSKTEVKLDGAESVFDKNGKEIVEDTTTNDKPSKPNKPSKPTYPTYPPTSPEEPTEEDKDPIDPEDYEDLMKLLVELVEEAEKTKTLVSIDEAHYYLDEFNAYEYSNAGVARKFEKDMRNRLKNIEDIEYTDEEAEIIKAIEKLDPTSKDVRETSEEIKSNIKKLELKSLRYRNSIFLNDLNKKLDQVDLTQEEKKAVKAVEGAEKTRNQESIESAEKAVYNLKFEYLKDNLSFRLFELELEIEAEEAVEVAKRDNTVINNYFARQCIYRLRLDEENEKILEELEEMELEYTDEEKQVVEAVKKAEKSKKQTDIDAAKKAIKGLKYPEEDDDKEFVYDDFKMDLVFRLRDIDVEYTKEEKQAIGLVELVEKSKDKKDIEEAKNAVNALGFEYLKDDLSYRLLKVGIKIDAKELVENAEEIKTQESVDAAKNKIDSLGVYGNFWTELKLRLRKVELVIEEEPTEENIFKENINSAPMTEVTNVDLLETGKNLDKAVWVEVQDKDGEVVGTGGMTQANPGYGVAQIKLVTPGNYVIVVKDKADGKELGRIELVIEEESTEENIFKENINSAPMTEVTNVDLLETGKNLNKAVWVEVQDKDGEVVGTGGMTQANPGYGVAQIKLVTPGNYVIVVKDEADGEELGRIRLVIFETEVEAVEEDLKEVDLDNKEEVKEALESARELLKDEKLTEDQKASLEVAIAETSVDFYNNGDNNTPKDKLDKKIEKLKLTEDDAVAEIKATILEDLENNLGIEESDIEKIIVEKLVGPDTRTSATENKVEYSYKIVFYEGIALEGEVEITLVTEEETAEEAANKFKKDHEDILNKELSDIAVTDKAAIEAAIEAYNDLSEEVKTKLEGEKADLDAKLNKVGDLETAEAAVAALEDAVRDDGDDVDSLIAQAKEAIEKVTNTDISKGLNERLAKQKKLNEASNILKGKTEIELAEGASEEDIKQAVKDILEGVEVEIVDFEETNNTQTISLIVDGAKIEREVKFTVVADKAIKEIGISDKSNIKIRTKSNGDISLDGLKELIKQLDSSIADDKIDALFNSVFGDKKIDVSELDANIVKAIWKEVKKSEDSNKLMPYRVTILDGEKVIGKIAIYENGEAVIEKSEDKILEEEGKLIYLDEGLKNLKTEDLMFMAKRIQVADEGKTTQLAVTSEDLIEAYSNEDAKIKGKNFKGQEVDAKIVSEAYEEGGLSIDLSIEDEKLYLNNTSMTKKLFEAIKTSDKADETKPYSITITNGSANNPKTKLAKIEFTLEEDEVVARLVAIKVED